MPRITRTKIAEQVGLPRTRISELFLGRAPMGIKTATRFAQFLGITTGQVIDMDLSELERRVTKRIEAEETRHLKA